VGVPCRCNPCSGMCKTEVRGFRVEMYKDIDMDKKMGEQFKAVLFSTYPLQAMGDAKDERLCGNTLRRLFQFEQEGLHLRQ